MKPNKKNLIVWSNSSSDALVFPQKESPESFMVNITFSAKHLVWAIKHGSVDK